MKRILLFMLVLLMITSCASCAKGDTQDNITTPETNISGPNENTSDQSGHTTDQPNDPYADLPDSKYGGYVFNILNSTSSTWALNIMHSDGLSGEVVNDAIYERNTQTEEKLDITINIINDTEVAAKIRTQFQAQDKTYDCFYLQAASMATLALEGILTDLNTIESINMDAPWWYPQTNGPLNFGSRTYMLLSDANLSFHESYYMVAFNKNLLASFTDMQSPYELIEKNEWTIDVMNKMIVDASADLNGDGVMKSDADRFGICGATNIGYSVLGSLEVSPFNYDSNHIPSFAGATEKLVSAYEKVVSTLYNPSYAVNSSYHPVFAAGRSLFLIEVSGTLKQHRDSEIDYGIVTLPKYDSSQERYMSTITPTGCSTVAIPAIGGMDLERTGVILENFTALSRKLMLPAYYDVTLSYKYARDELSIKMLDIIYQNGYLEVGYVYNFGNIRNTMQNTFVAQSTNITAPLKAISKIVEREIEAAVSKVSG